MKNKLLYLLKMVSKNVLYAFAVQMVFYSVVLAEEGIAQYASIKEVYVEINLDKANIKEALETIEHSTDFHFSYDKKVLSENESKLSMKKKRQSLYKVLATISKESGLNFTRINNNIVVSQPKSGFVRGVQEVLADDISISGKVISDEDGEGLPGVSIIVKGTTTGTTTDIDGNYKLSVNEDAILIYSFVGFVRSEVSVAGRSVVDVVLELDATQLDELVVTAYGTSKKSAFTGAATQINSEAIQGRALTNITSAIEGAAGIQFSPGSGQPGSSSPIRIRGFGSINASSSPLYVVDGVIFSGSLSSINPSDIESITVLKDTSSTALYGSKAANGVVMLTTKTGKDGQSQFNINISQGFSGRAIQEYDRVSAQQYYPLMWESLRNSKSMSGGTDVDVANQEASDEIFSELGMNPFNVDNDQIVGVDGKLNPAAQLLYADDLDWQDQLARQGKRSNVDVSYQGGNDKTDYFFSMSYLDDKGWIINSDFKRISGRVKMNTQPKKWFKTGFNLGATSSESNQANDGGSSSFVNPFYSSRNIAPIYPVHMHDPATGEYILDQNGNKIYDLGDDRVGNTNGRHIIQETELNIDRDKIFSVSGRTYADLYFLNDFKFTVNASIDKRFFNNDWYDNPTVGDGAPDGRAGKLQTVRTSITFNQLLNYNKDFGDHTIDVLLGHENFEYEYNRFEGDRKEMIAEGNIELGNYVTLAGLDSRTDTYNNEGYFSRLNYDYQDKYFLTASVRTDGSSRFHKDTRWGTFWSLGGAWIIDKESFFNVPFVDRLKLRASYGEVGNDSNLDDGAMGFYANQALFSLGNNNASEPGVLLDQLAAPSLMWETNVQSDIALEFSVLDYRLSGSIEYYNRITSDLLFEVPLPLSTGVEFVNQNIGTMYNRGIEIGLSAEIIRTENLSWRLDVNASTIKNEITELPQEEIINGSKKLVVGGSIYDYWRRQWYGVDPADGAGLYLLDPELELDETDPDVRNIDGTMVTADHNDALYGFVGSAVPDLFGSFTNTISYKNFNLGFLFTYQVGGKTYDTNYASLMSAGNYGTAASTDLLNRWQKPGDVTDVPRLDEAQTSRFGAASSRWMVSSSYIALRQITFSYNLPSSLMERAGLGNARVYVNTENVFLKTARKGLDVNQNFNGTTQNRFTPARVFTVGLNVTF